MSEYSEYKGKLSVPHEGRFTVSKAPMIDDASLAHPARIPMDLLQEFHQLEPVAPATPEVSEVTALDEIGRIGNMTAWMRKAELDANLFAQTHSEQAA